MTMYWVAMGVDGCWRKIVDIFWVVFGGGGRWWIFWVVMMNGGGQW